MSCSKGRVEMSPWSEDNKPWNGALFILWKRRVTVAMAEDCISASHALLRYRWSRAVTLSRVKDGSLDSLAEWNRGVALDIAKDRRNILLLDRNSANVSTGS